MVVSALELEDQGDKLHFVFELTRHGARAPMLGHDGFKVGVEQLTAQGMRQRYLLGAYNRRRYLGEYNLIDLENADEEILMMSTLVNRTMQSGYSELMGMLHKERSVKLTPQQERALSPKGPASPPFRVKD